MALPKAIKEREYNKFEVGTDGETRVKTSALSIPMALGNLFFTKATDSLASPDLNVNGSVTPVEFFIRAEAGETLNVEELRFKAFDNGIKIDTFLALNSALTNGIAIRIKSRDETSDFINILDTADFNSHFAFGPGGKFDITVGAGNDLVSTTFGPSAPFVIEPQDTFGPGNDDFVRVTIQDNLSTINFLDFIAFGFRS